jgi:hypothetical protein
LCWRRGPRSIGRLRTPGYRTKRHVRCLALLFVLGVAERFAFVLAEPRFNRASAVSNSSCTQPNKGWACAIAAVAEKSGFRKPEPVADLAFAKNVLCSIHDVMKLL